ncbi:hypothetical protein BDV29DRAFT_198878 [Aspergillus leporis]|uniref:Alpha-galactosidase A n=1 Tax=Aspergillus leporis TaxID=41062 RepID=A0A5N5WL48_9EURO|nr:hypothetical protein BDV29DRAFT_198878 [Aspergillus leporis]
MSNADRWEEMLGLDLQDNDYLYRIRKGSRIIYVQLLHAELMPYRCRTQDDRVLACLRKLPQWDSDWRTLTVRKNSRGIIQSTPNEFLPPALDLRTIDLPPSTFYVNVLDLIPVGRTNHRTTRVRYNDETCILKLASFQFETRTIQNEILIHSILTERGFPSKPRFIGLAYEESKDRTVGFLIEDTQGRVPGPQDLDACVRTIRQMHDYGVLHKCFHKYKMRIEGDGAKIFGFATSTTISPENTELVTAEEDPQILLRVLEDKSSIGGPFPFP